MVIYTKFSLSLKEITYVLVNSENLAFKCIALTFSSQVLDSKCLY